METGNSDRNSKTGFAYLNTIPRIFRGRRSSRSCSRVWMCCTAPWGACCTCTRWQAPSASWRQPAYGNPWLVSGRRLKEETRKSMRNSMVSMPKWGLVFWTQMSITRHPAWRCMLHKKKLSLNVSSWTFFFHVPAKRVDRNVRLKRPCGCPSSMNTLNQNPIPTETQARIQDLVTRRRPKVGQRFPEVATPIRRPLSVWFRFLCPALEHRVHAFHKREIQGLTLISRTANLLCCRSTQFSMGEVL